MKVAVCIAGLIALSAANVARAERTFLKCDFTDKKAKDKKKVSSQIFAFDSQDFKFWTGHGWGSGAGNGWEIQYRYRPNSLSWHGEGCKENDSSQFDLTCTSNIDIDRTTGAFTWHDGHGVPGGFKVTREAAGTCAATTEPTYVAPPPVPTKF